MAKKKRKAVSGIWGGEDSAVDPTMVDDLESPDMLNVDPSIKPGMLRIRAGRKKIGLTTEPIVSEFNDGTTGGGAITGIFEFNAEGQGSELIITHGGGVDHKKRRGATLKITTTSPLVGGTEGVAYTDTVDCVGGLSTYTWSVFAGALPPGLALAGATTVQETISGTPTTAGTYTFTMRVTDSSLPWLVAYKILTITISSVTPP